MEPISTEFFNRSPVACARDLIGASFHWNGCAGRIVETEAYLSSDDPACHTWNRPSARAFVEQHQAGDAYVYLNYGVHWMFNGLVKSDEGSGFVLLRAVEPVAGIDRIRERRVGVVDHLLGAGPGKLTRALGIDGSAHGTSFLNCPGCGIVTGGPVATCAGGRIGISKAVELPWRFGDPASRSLSRKFEPCGAAGVGGLRSAWCTLGSVMIPFSVLDLVPIVAGGDAGQALRNSLDLARHAEKWGFYRYWVAEHHNMPGIASAATSVVIAYLAAGTSTIRVGSGGIMLPNHAPLAIAEQFGTLESLFPGRIDLGLGRAPGGDQITARALRRFGGGSGDSFPQDVVELQGYFRPVVKDQLVQAVPGAGLEVPFYLLGSSDFGATLAAQLGLPFAFASHFAPDHLQSALAIYRRAFRTSIINGKPHAMVAVNVFAADTDDEARVLFTSLQQQFLNLIRGFPGQLQPPAADMSLRWSPAEELHVRRMTRYSLVGSAASIRRQVKELIEETAADEVIATALIHDHAARLRSFEILAEVMKSLG